MSGVLRAVAGAPSKVAATTGLSQDNIIFAMVLFAFVVWITTKGELSTYLAFFKPSGGAQGPQVVNVTASSTTGASAGTPSPGGGGNVVPSGIPGVPGINTANPLAGIPVIGGLTQFFTGTASAGTVGSFLKSLGL